MGGVKLATGVVKSATQLFPKFQIFRGRQSGEEQAYRKVCCQYRSLAGVVEVRFSWVRNQSCVGKRFIAKFNLGLQVLCLYSQGTKEYHEGRGCLGVFIREN